MALAFRHLKWLTILFPLPTLALHHHLTSFVLDDFFHSSVGFAATIAIAAVGIVVIYLAIQTLGVSRMRFVLRLGLPMGHQGATSSGERVTRPRRSPA